MNSNVTNKSTIRNPIASVGHDPFVIQKNGLYYYSYSHEGSIWINKHRTLREAVQFKGKKIWSPEQNKPFSMNVWAPELHFLNEKWYVYFAADNGDNENHRMYVLESKTVDPLGEYVFMGKIYDHSDKWAIDGTVLEYSGDTFFIWSGWEGNKNIQQNLYIAKMKTPMSITGKRTLISKPEYDWEKIGQPFVNEGPQILKNKNQVFVIYSASGSWTNNYCLGQLKLSGNNPLEAGSWTKFRTPVFSGTETVFSPGHASFVKSPDGKEDWIVYHTAKEKSSGWNRDVNTKKFNWEINGNPNFGYPVSKGIDFTAPSQ